jgi:hypothetical protein
LVTDQAWAQSYLERERNAVRISSVDEVLERLQSTERVEQVAQGRMQLALGLS